MKGNHVEFTIVLVCLVVLGVVGAHWYFKGQESDYSSFAKDARDIRLMNEALSKQIEMMAKDQRVFVQAITDKLDQHSKDIEALRSKKHEGPISVKISEPVRIDLVYRSAAPKIRPLIPTQPPKNGSGKKSTMLERAGIQ